MNFVNCFSLPILFEYLDMDLKYLKKYCLNLEKNSPGRIYSNYGGWQSSDLDLLDPEIVKLGNIILRSSAYFLERMNFKGPAELRLSNIWVNINRKASFNRPHNHPSSFLSGVFYVDCPANCGELLFKNPSNLQSIITNDDHFSSFNEYNSLSYRITPEVNKLVLFQSHMEHYVEPNLSDDPRISLSFNVVYDMNLPK